MFCNLIFTLGFKVDTNRVYDDLQWILRSNEPEHCKITGIDSHKCNINKISALKSVIREVLGKVFADFKSL